MKMRLKVSISKDQAAAQISLAIFFAVFFGAVGVSIGGNPVLWCSIAVLFGMAAVLFLMAYKNKKLVACDWGIIFCDAWGKVKKVRYQKITLIKLCPSRGSTLVKFYAGDTCVGSCSSNEHNYQPFMKYISYQMPDKIEW